MDEKRSRDIEPDRHHRDTPTADDERFDWDTVSHEACSSGDRVAQRPYELSAQYRAHGKHQQDVLGIRRRDDEEPREKAEGWKEQNRNRQQRASAASGLEAGMQNARDA